VQGVGLAELGHHVTCVDLDSAKIEVLRAGTSPIYEPGIEDLITRNVAEGRLHFTTPADGWAPLLAEVVFVAVGTPMAENGAADLSYVRMAIAAIVSASVSPMTIVMKSTVPPGTGHLLTSRYFDGPGQQIGYVSNPEFLREGQAIRDFFEPDRIVLGGTDNTDIDRVAAVYEPLVERLKSQNRVCPIVRTDVASAETIKYASNAFLSTKISFINEMANVCDCIGADVDDVAYGMGLDARIGSHFLRAGIGYGGSCFPKDTRALDFISTLNGYQFDLLKAVIDVNNRQRLLPVIHLVRALPELHTSKIAVLGLAFKPFTDDVRESPTLDIVPLLLEEGAHVACYDPVATDVDLGGATRCDTVWDAVADASAAVLVTEWPELLELDWVRAASVMKPGAIIFDGRNALNRESVEAAGLTYMAVGRPGSHRR
jgi:UDPglucose 6-dehydrogenase